jgi:hypothetical protein
MASADFSNELTTVRDWAFVVGDGDYGFVDYQCKLTFPDSELTIDSEHTILHAGPLGSMGVPLSAMQCWAIVAIAPILLGAVFIWLVNRPRRRLA